MTWLQKLPAPKCQRLVCRKLGPRWRKICKLGGAESHPTVESTQRCSSVAMVDKLLPRNSKTAKKRLKGALREPSKFQKARSSSRRTVRLWKLPSEAPFAVCKFVSPMTSTPTCVLPGHTCAMHRKTGLGGAVSRFYTSPSISLTWTLPKGHMTNTEHGARTVSVSVVRVLYRLPSCPSMMLDLG